MDKRDFDKALWNLFEFTKEIVGRNVLVAIHGKLIKIEQDQAQRLLFLVNSSIDEAHAKSIKNYRKLFDQTTNPQVKKKAKPR